VTALPRRSLINRTDEFKSVFVGVFFRWGWSFSRVRLDQADFYKKDSIACSSAANAGGNNSF
jgi:hypothetical protein